MSITSAFGESVDFTEQVRGAARADAVSSQADNKITKTLRLHQMDDTHFLHGIMW